MAEAGLDEWEAWHCCREPKGERWLCPEEGCPESYGCAREHGWRFGMPSPPECRGRKPLQDIVERLRNESSKWRDHDDTHFLLCREAADEIERLRRFVDGTIAATAHRAGITPNVTTASRPGLDPATVEACARVADDMVENRRRVSAFTAHACEAIARRIRALLEPANT